MDKEIKSWYHVLDFSETIVRNEKSPLLFCSSSRNVVHSKNMVTNKRSQASLENKQKH